MFEKLFEFETTGLCPPTKQAIVAHLRFKNNSKTIFPIWQKGGETFPRNSFSTTIDLGTVPVQKNFKTNCWISEMTQPYVTRLWKNHSLNFGAPTAPCCDLTQRYRRKHYASSFHSPRLTCVKADSLFSLIPN